MTYCPLPTSISAWASAGLRPASSAVATSASVNGMCNRCRTLSCAIVPDRGIERDLSSVRTVDLVRDRLHDLQLTRRKSRAPDLARRRREALTRYVVAVHRGGGTRIRAGSPILIR